MYPDSVVAALCDEQAGTPPLSDFVRTYHGHDPNLFWRLDCGHHQNLLDEALDLLAEYGWRP